MKILFLSLLTIAHLTAQQSITLQAPPPPPVTTVSANVVGNAGNGSYCYWVIANYPRGQAFPGGPACIDRAPSVLSSGNSINVTWSPQPGATTYDVLRTTSATFPAIGSCSCAVAIGLTSFIFSDTGGSLAAYVLTPAQPATGTITLNNRDQASPTFVFSPPAGTTTTTDASQLITGTLPFARLPIGTTANTVPAGNDSRFAPASTLTISTLFGVTGGCNPNTGIKTGGAACTDGGTAAINTAIASLPRPLLVNWDIGIGTTGIVLGTQGQIAVRCSPGAGVFVVNGSNSSGFYMSHATNSVQDGLAAASTQGSNLEVSGCIINGNRNSTQLNTSPNFPLTNSTGSDPHGNAAGDGVGLPFPWMFGIHVSNMQNVLLQNNTFIDISTYAMVFDNVQHAAVVNNRIYTKSFIYNQDPVHLNGYTSDFDIRGNYSDQGDDAVALNAPEGYAGIGAGSGISNIRVSNENWFNCWNGIRIYAGTNKTVSNVVLSNITGHAQNAFMKLGGEGSYAFVQGQLGIISVNNTIFQADSYPFILWESAKQLNLNGLTLTSSGSPGLFDAENSSGNIQQLNITAMDPGSISTITGNSQGGYVGPTINSLQSIVGPGVMNTGLVFPDLRIGNNTTFLSDGSSVCSFGALCWRNNATSQQLLPSAVVPGTVQKWLMNEGTGTTFADSSGHANTLTASNVTFTTQTGIPGLTPTFNGSGTSGAVAANTTNTAVNLNGSTPVTLSFWAKRSSSGSLQVIMGNQNGPGFYIAKQSDERIYIQLADSTGGLINKKYQYVLTAGTPDNLTVTYDGSKTAAGMKLYFNGALVATDTVFNDTLVGSAASTVPWTIGNLIVPFAGSIADVRLWNRLLSGTEITAITTAGAQ